MDTGGLQQSSQGKHASKNKIDECLLQGVRDHILSFQVVDSHYCRAASVKKYPVPSLSVAGMYRLYQCVCVENGQEQVCEDSIVRNYKRKTEMYNTEDMRKAVEQCQAGNMGYKKAAKLFNVNLSTLKDQVRGKRQKMGAGRLTVLGSALEAELSECIQLLANWGFGFTRSETKELVGEFTNKDIFTDFFELFRQLCEDNGIMNNPSRIFNVDESGFPLDASRSKVLCQKGVRQLFNVIGGSGRDQITVNGCCSADGKMLPPYIVYAAKNLRLKWTEGGPAGSKFNVTDKGWMEADCFHDWFKNHFIPNISPARPVLLLFDASHITLKLVQAAREEKVILLKLTSNSTSVLEPLDVGVYGPVKTAWDKILVKFSRQNLGTALTKELFPSLLRELWDHHALGPDNIKAGFKKCGLVPFDPVPVLSKCESQLELVAAVSVNQTSTSSSSTAPLPTLSSGPSSAPETSFSSGPSSAPSAFTSSSSVTPPATLSSTLSSAPPSPTAPLPTASSRPSSTPPTTSFPSSLPTFSRPSSAPPSFSASHNHSQESLKDFFLKKLTPLLNTRNMNKDDTGVRNKAVRRQYAESLTSEQCLQRLQQEKTEKEGKVKEKKNGKGPGKGLIGKGKGRKGKLVLEDSDNEDLLTLDDEFPANKINCLICNVNLDDREKCKMSVQCDICDCWCCLLCSEMSVEELETSDFYCKKCVPR